MCFCFVFFASAEAAKLRGSGSLPTDGALSKSNENMRNALSLDDSTLVGALSPKEGMYFAFSTSPKTSLSFKMGTERFSIFLLLQLLGPCADTLYSCSSFLF